jgi:hypothetical protein
MNKATVVLIAICAVVCFSGAIDVADYMPLGIGYSWISLDSLSTGIDTSYEQIFGTTTMFDFLTYMYLSWSTDTSANIDTVYRQLRPGDGIYYLMQMQDDVEAYIPSRIAPDPFNIGDDWLQIDWDTTESSGGYITFVHLHSVGHALGFEDVVVPAGRFSDCVKILSEGDCSLVVSVMGTPMFSYVGPINTDTMWVAEDVGVVKSFTTQYDIESGEGSDTKSSLMSYSFTNIDETAKSRPGSFDISITPNPFNSTCKITAPTGSTIGIFDLQGKNVATLSVAQASPNQASSFNWKPTDPPPGGVYLVKATSADGKFIGKKLVYLK